VVYDDSPSAARESAQTRRWNDCADDSGGVFMARVLQYLETPQYLRRALFPMHASLRYVVGISFTYTAWPSSPGCHYNGFSLSISKNSKNFEHVICLIFSANDIPGARCTRHLPVVFEVEKGFSMKRPWVIKFR
jgi:hypothetical protein